ncbi:MAG: FkbM family methyltransferase [Zoogloeaceae bacterium]|nr:FkbM family methyltransferase [Zoogloeaceae bacterium]
MSTIDKFTNLLRNCKPAPAKWSPGAHPVVIYGAGDIGTQVAVTLRARGLTVAGLLDEKARPGQCFDGLPVSTLSDWLSNHDPSRYEILIAISNPVFLSQLPELSQKITSHGFAQCIHSLHELMHIISPNALPPQFENAKQCYEQSLQDITRLDALLSDEKSRLSVMDFVRANCLEEAVKEYSPNDLYCPADLPPWPQPLRFIDGGAFIGDTLADFSQHGYRFEAIVAFEPDQENFRRFVSNTVQYENLIRFPCALGDKTKMLHFYTGGYAGAHIVSKGSSGSSIQCAAIDDILPGFRPNLIKMDVEGAEPEALMGAKNLISRNRPHLAICLYHQLDHLWRIPLMIHEWNLGYRFYIRQHRPLFDIVLYAYPEN